VGAELQVEFLFIAVAAGTMAIDQASKAWAAVRLGNGRSIALGRWLRLRCVLNRVGLARWPRERPATVLLVAVALAIIVSAPYVPPLRSVALLVGFGLVVGGAAGNLADRVRRKAVIDFIDLGWWPVFNMADVAIVVGTAVALWSLVSSGSRLAAIG
jgi:signal peptidase II